jgi:hypothetical protein
MSRKKKKRSRKKGARRSKPRPPRQGLLEDARVVVSPPGERKMSEVLLEFVEPYSGQWRTEEEFKKLLTVAVIAWNAALHSGSQRDEFIQDMVRAVPPEVRPDMRAIIEEMIQRKVSRFASNKRMIIDYRLTTTQAGPHLSVISTLDTV